MSEAPPNEGWISLKNDSLQRSSSPLATGVGRQPAACIDQTPAPANGQEKKNVQY